VVPVEQGAILIVGCLAQFEHSVAEPPDAARDIDLKGNGVPCST
jgi:hypothetical protein